ncbi:TolC family outer membrane protein [Stakelama saccharophila]|uniref:TolC family outer membrane protein n=1 Tax=Stakelama saccharophila TaxID=3075605 RepID=A0ABZ0B6I5_9SPHN|nr:TolC family outer membrane protein [Stakelama sp. W311]WNO52993.1 TolC family outer membrane protein [Stakelama sp. W311]
MSRLARLILGTTAVALTIGPAQADTLREALIRAYRSNPTITGARADLRATDEDVPIAKADGRPSVDTRAGYTENLLQPGNTFTSPGRQATGGVSLGIPIYQGGAVENGVRAAETRVLAGRANLRGTEAQLFTDVVAAYMNVIRDQAVVQLNQRNVHALEVNLQATKDRFEVGDLTRTDVAQSEARLAQAQGQLRSAQASLISSREDYIAVVGEEPTDLQPPPDLPNMPNGPAVAVNVALDENPSLIAARRSRDASAFDVQSARAGRLPKLNVVVGGDYYNYLGSLGSGTGVQVGQSGTSATVGLALTMPLFQGGRPAAQVRQAQAREGSAIEQVAAVERDVVAQTRSAYASWQASQYQIESSRAAVRANRLSLEGVRAENSVGTRTILDILNAEQELLNAQVDLVTAQRNAYVAGFALLAAMGEAEAEDLQLDAGGLYDPTVHYERVEGKFWDWDDDPAPEPAATGTADTEPQTATVTGDLDDTLAVDPETGEQKAPNPADD